MNRIIGNFTTFVSLKSDSYEETIDIIDVAAFHVVGASQ